MHIWVKLMRLTKNDIEMLQEQLILVYKTIHQDRQAKNFYFQGIETKESSSQLVNKINELENPEETLKLCILELEEKKQNKELKNKDFNELMENYDIGFLKRKYYIEKTKDLDRLNILHLLDFL